MSVRGRPNSRADVRFGFGSVYHVGQGMETMFEATNTGATVVAQIVRHGHAPASYPRAN